jgi:hypothetical protein
MSIAMIEQPLRHRRGPGAIVAVTVLLGLSAAVAVAAGTDPAGRTFAAVSEPTHSLMSVTVAFLGVVAVGRLHPPVGPAPVLSTVGNALVLAMPLAGFGVLVSVVATAAFPSTATGGRWSGAGAVVLGSFLVQGVALLVGTGLGLLIRRPVLACLATIVLPLGLWWLLGTVGVLRPAQAWLTPFPSVQHLLSGSMSATNWAEWLVVLAIWGVGLNALGILGATRRRARI